jgi:class 3 adenylate cyclase
LAASSRLTDRRILAFVLNGAQSVVLTFLIADIRGYSRFTEEYGDEAAARLAGKFTDVAKAGVEEHGGDFEAVRGDEGVAVFTSARQALRAAVDLQNRFAREFEGECDFPLRVGIGIDSGEAVRLDDGSYRGSALNVAARLCARAHGGEVLVTEATTRLAGRLEGIRYTNRGRASLKNIPDPVQVVRVSSEAEPLERRSLGSVLQGDRRLLWLLGLLVVLTATLTAGTVAYVANGGTGTLAEPRGLAAVVPPGLWQDCAIQGAPMRGAVETAVCLPQDGLPDRWTISAYRDAVTLEAAYEALREGHGGKKRDAGQCNAFSWGGELQWLHGPGRPGGRAFCFFDGNEAVIVWTHRRLDQPTHRDVLVVARESGGDHVRLTRWWRPWHHLIGVEV